MDAVQIKTVLNMKDILLQLLQNHTIHLPVILNLNLNRSRNRNLILSRIFNLSNQCNRHTLVQVRYVPI